MSKAAVEAIKARFGDAVVSTHDYRGDDTVVVKRDRLVEICEFLKHDPAMQFTMPVDVCGVDYLGRKEPRFEVVYHLYSHPKKQRVRLKVEVDEHDCWVPSVTCVWKGVSWFEREAFDMFGVVFKGHPNHKRVLLYEGFEGHPLRKDYPQRGYQPRMEMPTLASEVEKG